MRPGESTHEVDAPSAISCSRLQRGRGVRGKHGGGAQYPVHHVRPAARRSPVCAGHPHLKTRNLDALARRGVRFPRAYVQSGVCGPSRMTYYTGRYVFTHGATWNRVPLSRRREDAGRLSARGRHARGAGRQDARAARRRRAGALGARRRLGLAALMRAGRFEELDRYDGHPPPGPSSALRRTTCARRATTPTIRGATT